MKRLRHYRYSGCTAAMRDVQQSDSMSQFRPPEPELFWRFSPRIWYATCLASLPLCKFHSSRKQAMWLEQYADGSSGIYQGIGVPQFTSVTDPRLALSLKAKELPLFLNFTWASPPSSSLDVDITHKIMASIVSDTTSP